MELAKESLDIIYSAIEYAHSKRYEYVTPEIVLLMILRNKTFAEAFEACGGNIESLKRYLKEYAEEYMDRSDVEKPELSEGVDMMLEYAAKSAYNSGNTEICIRHMIHGLWNLDNCYAVYFLEKQGISEIDLLQEMAYIEENEDNEKAVINKTSDTEESHSGWRMYAPCMNETVSSANPLIGREPELDRTIQILCRKDKNNPLHIGEPGVGKTALTYGLVQRINDGNVPDPLKGAKVFALDLGGMLAGTQYRGDFEKRFKKVLTEIGKEEKPIIYIDEIHNLSGAGAVGEGAFDASNLLKPYLSDGKIRFIGATTFEEYKKYFEKNKSLVRRFQNIEIKEPSEEETIHILEGLCPKYAKFHGVIYGKGVIEYAVHMSSKYINERFLPDKAIDLIDEAGAYRKIHASDAVVDKSVIDEVLTTICRIPAETVSADDLSGLAVLEDKLKKRVFGQDTAIEQVVNAVKFSKAGLLEENKPLASLLFVGPTGVGKTEIARSLAEELGVKLIRFDMSEYGEKHAAAKLIGSPAGYVGYEDGGLLTEAIRKTPSSVLLLDEIEKAHSDIYNILLQVMDYATLTDNQGRKADFRNVIVIMTSNAGADRVGKSTIGFHSDNLDASAIMEAVKQTFQPEFRNRLNKIVVFNSMDKAMAKLIIGKKLGELSAQLKARKIEFTADESARELVLSKGVTPEFGAREVDRVIRNEIKPLFVDEILFGSLKTGGRIELTASEGRFRVSSVQQ